MEGGGQKFLGPRGVKYLNTGLVMTNTGPPMVAKSPTQITNNFMGITPHTI